MNFLTTLKKCNVSLNTVTRAKFQKFPYEQDRILEPYLLKSFNCWLQIQLEHYQHFKFSIDHLTQKVIVEFTNESTKKSYDCKALLGKSDMQNPKYVFIDKGFTRVFDYNDPADLKLFKKFVFGITLKPANDNQVIPNFNEIYFQDLNLMDEFSELNHAVVIQPENIDVLVPNDPVKSDLLGGFHAISQKGQFYCDNYAKGQDMHKELLSKWQRMRHGKIAEKMDWYKELIKKYPKIKDYFS